MRPALPHTRVPRATGRFRSRILAVVAMAMAATMLGGCVVEVPGHYHGGWHHHYDYR